jgi:hypothetical protein
MPTTSHGDLVPSLVWNQFGTNQTVGWITYTEERAPIADFSIVPGYSELAARLSEHGFKHSRRWSVGAFQRSSETEFQAGRPTTRITGYSFFASIRFVKQLDLGAMILHRAARCDYGESFESVVQNLKLSSGDMGTLTWEAAESIVCSAPKRSLFATAIFVYGLAMPFVSEFGEIVVAYRRPPTKRQPNGPDAAFVVSASDIRTRLKLNTTTP